MKLDPSMPASSMSVRDALAANAPSPPSVIICGMLEAVVRRLGHVEVVEGEVWSEAFLSLLARWNYRYADAMIAQAQKPTIEDQREAERTND